MAEAVRVAAVLLLPAFLVVGVALGAAYGAWLGNASYGAGSLRGAAFALLPLAGSLLVLLPLVGAGPDSWKHEDDVIRVLKAQYDTDFPPGTDWSYSNTGYIAAVVKLAKHYHRSPDQLSDEEVQTYLAHLINDRKLSWSTRSQAANAT